MSDLSKFRAEQLQDPEFREYYLDQKANSDIAKAIIGARMEKNLSQKDLAALTGIAQADISRFERCDGSPSVRTLKKLAKGLGMAVKIEFVPIETVLAEAGEDTSI